MNPHLTYNEIIELIDQFDPVNYAKTRNHLEGGVSRLSPYITRGVISLPIIRDQLLKKYQSKDIEKFIQELAWREYFQKVYFSKGQEIFTELRFSRNDWRHHNIVSAIRAASTGIEAIDQEINQLMTIGYMHNHARMWVAMLACNIAKAHWFNMSRWLYYHLIDGDLASNTLSWQWVAGTSVQKQYFANQSLINGCSNIKQSATYLSLPPEDLPTMEIPDVLKTEEAFSYLMSYPESESIGNVAGKKVFLYHPWSIDPNWRREEEGERLFIIEPRLFDKFPVSPTVLNHMLKLLRTHVPKAKVFVGNIETVPGISGADVFSKSHPHTLHFPGQKDEPVELFPQVQGYYPSFYKFWQECQKYI